MSDKLVYLFGDDFSIAEFEELINKFEGYGITLSNPSTHDITIFTSDGDNFNVSKEWILGQIRERKTVSILWWISDSIDLYNRLRFLKDGFVEEYDLDGFQKGIDLEPMVDILSTRFKERMKAGKVSGFVIDNDQVAPDYDWDDFFLWGADVTLALPAYIGLAKNKLSQIKQSLDGMKVEFLGDFAIISHI